MCNISGAAKGIMLKFPGNVERDNELNQKTLYALPLSKLRMFHISEMVILQYFRKQKVLPVLFTYV